MQLNDLKHPALTLSATLDGYRVEIDPASREVTVVRAMPNCRASIATLSRALSCKAAINCRSISSSAGGRMSGKRGSNDVSDMGRPWYSA